MIKVQERSCETTVMVKEKMMKKKRFILRKNTRGFSLLEVLISMVIVGILALSVFMTQTLSWKQVTSSNRLVVAGHMIDQQIERLRMRVYSNPAVFFPPPDSSVTGNGVTLSWQQATALRPDGSALTNVKQYTFTATWGKTFGDTLKVTTYLAKLF